MHPVVILCTPFQRVTWCHWSVCMYTDDTAVFRIKLPEVALNTSLLSALLQPGELARAKRYFREEDRNRFLIARTILRILIGNYLKQHPAMIQFNLGINNKPDLGEGTGWHVNVSHSDKWVLVAVSRATVGIDVERVNEKFQFLDVLTQSFNADEQWVIKNGPNDQELFYRLWTRKEAVVKATAKGIDDDFFLIPSLDGRHQSTDKLLGSTINWVVTSFNVCDGYPAAIAQQFPAETIKFYTVESGLLTSDES